jgi:hypothetical protein
MQTQRLFHGTSVKNVESILKQGLISKWEGVYLTDSIESAQRWCGFKLRAQGEDEIAIIEVDVASERLAEGTDHSEYMVKLFGVGKSLLSLENIPADKIKEVHLFKML